MELLRRNITERVLGALADTPVVLLHGARQTGKSTLVQALANESYSAPYVTFDNATILAGARRDPAGFLSDLGSPAILDEVQRAPELFLEIKTVIDRDRTPGRYLLTGSANVLLLPQLSESLTGRMEILTLWPFSQGEMERAEEDFIDRLFAKGKPALATVEIDRSEIIQRTLCGGYPESVSRPTPRRRTAWFESYVNTIVQRQVRDLANIEYLTEIPRLLRLLAARVGSLLNVAELSSSLGLPQTTIKRYLSLLEMMYLLHPVPAWSGNLGKRLIRGAKLVLNDTGLVSYLTGLDEPQIQQDPTRLGPLLEDFVVMELRKQISWSSTRPHLYHFCTRKGHEVDIVIEDASGQVVGIEVKAASTVREEDLKGLRYFRDLVGTRFKRGLVLYTGSESVPFGDDLYAVPIGRLWRAEP
jgi:predicted AAA+ superfamily ATPase